MKIKLSEYQTGKIIYSTELSSDFAIDTDIEGQTTNVVMDNYSVKLTEKWFNGIYISTAQIIPGTEVDYLFETSCDHVCLLFCLSGSLNFYAANKTTHFLTLDENQHSVTLGQLNNVIFSVAEDTQYVYIQLTTEYFKKITNQDYTAHRKRFLNEATCPEMILILKKLTNHDYSGRAERIYLESKILGLVVFFIERQTSKLTTLKTDDLDKLSLAKKIVEDNLQKPFSLIELSRKAGINDYKLKKGFKELTGFTVFGYIFKLRMENAYHFLLQERKQVNEVSFLVGYKNPQHFIAAFKRYFNILPGSLNKQT